METNSQISKEKLCKVALNKMILEAKKEITSQFKLYPGTIKMDLGLSVDDDETTLTRILYLENKNYDRITNITDFRKAKAFILEYFINSKEIYDNDLNFNNHGYDAQRQRIVEQLLVVKKTNYLKNLLSKVKSTYSVTSKEKIEWLGTPSEFGFLFNELEKAGYIKKSVHRRTKYKDAWAHTAELLFDSFSVPNLARNGETSPENLRKEVGNPTISDKDHGFFKITRPNHK